MQAIQQLMREMIAFDRGDARRIQHFVKVHAFAKLIGLAEGLAGDQLLTLEAAALVHDIAIVPCERQYGHCTGKMQEREGPALATAMLEKLGGFSPAVIGRVAQLVGRHHTYEGIDGPDCQILIEADFLVNLYEDDAAPQSVTSALQKIFRTSTGIEIFHQMFAKSGK